MTTMRASTSSWVSEPEPELSPSPSQSLNLSLSQSQRLSPSPSPSPEPEPEPETLIDGCDTASGLLVRLRGSQRIRTRAPCRRCRRKCPHRRDYPRGDDNPGEIILVLNSYEPANWQVNTGGGTISHIAVTGYNHSISTVSVRRLRGYGHERLLECVQLRLAVHDRRL